MSESRAISESHQGQDCTASPLEAGFAGFSRGSLVNFLGISLESNQNQALGFLFLIHLPPYPHPVSAGRFTCDFGGGGLEVRRLGKLPGDPLGTGGAASTQGWGTFCKSQMEKTVQSCCLSVCAVMLFPRSWKPADGDTRMLAEVPGGAFAWLTNGVQGLTSCGLPRGPAECCSVKARMANISTQAAPSSPVLVADKLINYLLLSLDETLKVL